MSELVRISCICTDDDKRAVAWLWQEPDTMFYIQPERYHFREKEPFVWRLLDKLYSDPGSLVEPLQTA